MNGVIKNLIKFKIIKNNIFNKKVKINESRKENEKKRKFQI